MTANTVELDALAAGDDVATDLVSSKHYQQVKLVDGAIDSETAIEAGAGADAGGMRVVLGATDNAVLDSIASNTAAIQTAVEILDNAISGNEMQVDIVSGGTGSTQYAEDSVHSSGDTGTMVLGVRQDTQADFGANGDYVPFSVDAEGAVRVALGATDNAVLDAIDTSLNNIEAAVGGTHTDDAAYTVGTDDGVPTFMLYDDTSTDTVNEGDAGIARMNSERVTIVTQRPETSGGLTPYKNIDVDESEDAIKASAGQVYFIHAMNLTNAVLYLKFYDATVASVTVGTTVPDLTFPIATQGDTNGAGFVLPIPQGLAFANAITVACTTGLADNDSGAPGANALVLNVGYA